MVPTVSVVIPTLNRLSFLKETIESLHRQTFRDWEAVVVDDGSTDGSWEWLVGEARQDARVRAIRRMEKRPEAQGAQVCRNVGWSDARSHYLLFLDSDDMLSSKCLAGRVTALDRNPGLDFVVGQCEHFTRRPGDCPDEIWSKWDDGQDDLDAFLGTGIPWQTSGPLWRWRALDAIGPWDESLVHVGHDHEFHVRALCRGLKYLKLPGIDYYWRHVREDSLSALESFKRHHADGGMILAFTKIIATVSLAGQWTAQRRETQRQEAINLATRCRLWGGTLRTASRAIKAARGQGLLSWPEQMEITAALAGWFRVADKIPSMAYLNRRYCVAHAVARGSEA